MEHNVVTEFEEVMQALDTVITMHFKRVLKSRVNALYYKYREKIIETSGQNELEALLKESVTRILPLLSNNYIKQIEIYYTPEGLIFYIYNCLRTCVFTELKIEEEDVPLFGTNSIPT